MIVANIESDIKELETDESLLQEVNYVQRSKALDVVEFNILGHIDALLEQNKHHTELSALRARATALQLTLENVDKRIFATLQQGIASTMYRGSTFCNAIYTYLPRLDTHTKHNQEVGYDEYDAFINGILLQQPLPETTQPLHPEMILYQKTPIRILLELVDALNPKENDVFYDIGSGLGHVPILVHLCAGIKTVGVEIESAYCLYANQCAAQLTLPDVEFINSDSRDVDFTKGTIFYMYSPFRGNVLTAVLEKLRIVSLEKSIRLFTYGLCSVEVASMPWLHCVNGNVDSDYVLYEFRSF